MAKINQLAKLKNLIYLRRVNSFFFFFVYLDRMHFLYCKDIYLHQRRIYRPFSLVVQASAQLE